MHVTKVQRAELPAATICEPRRNLASELERGWGGIRRIIHSEILKINPKALDSRKFLVEQFFSSLFCPIDG